MDVHGVHAIPELGDSGGARDLYPVPEAAYRLGISKAKAWQLIGSGRLKAKRLDGRTLVAAGVIRAFVAELPDVEPSEAAA